MYFAGLIRLHQYPRPLLERLDVFLKKHVSSLDFFTPKKIAKELMISEDFSWQIAFDLRDLGVICNVSVTQCRICKQITTKQHVTHCTRCGETEYFTQGICFSIC